MKPSANAHLIGEDDARRRLLTPSLLIDRAQLDANIAKMQYLCDEAGVALRPHGKAHKSSALAKRQIAAGAAGVCVATPGEAEVFADAGVRDILLTSTFASSQAITRVADVAAGGVRLSCVVDHPHVADAIAFQARHRGVAVPLLVDLDMGRQRAGVAGPEDAVTLARRILALEGVKLDGLQAYAGHLSHARDFAERKAGAAEATSRISAVLEALENTLDHRPQRVTGGSTGALVLELAGGIYTELQCGSYALMDTEYAAVDPDGSGAPMFAPSLFVATSVTSANHPGLATADAGEKRLASKYGVPPQIVRGAPEGTTYAATSDEHGRITLPEGTMLALGSLIELVVPHCDPTINLYDHLHVFEGDRLKEIWPIDARGA
ncbi:alanine racemase [Amorphus sp. 3PC139-8]|uniref:alanine racemase n=1 Tax=Amorphus sp. 3PC139-8 TaxID=2735676 RepID=UPI00345CB288